jgi:hypothetical protein
MPPGWVLPFPLFLFLLLLRPLSPSLAASSPSLIASSPSLTAAI